MCGIVGYLGNKGTESILIKKLKLLEYRGYDSAGICVLKNNKFYTTKSIGCIDKLNKKIKSINSFCGIAHTRWATHGKVSIENCHPHTSQMQNWTIVHNGIIENDAQLKKIYKIHTKGSTDTEIVANLLEINNKNDIHTLIDACDKLKGSYAIVALNKNNPDKLFIAKNKSPLYVSIKNEEVLVASDPICFKEEFDFYYTLKDNQFCYACKNALKFFNKKHKEITLQKINTREMKSDESEHKYKYFMEKEINEIPKILSKLTNFYKKNSIFFNFDSNFLNNVSNIKLIGCGTAYHACKYGEQILQKKLKINCQSFIASEYRYLNDISDKNTLCIFLSQSGETADTLGAFEKAKKQKCKTLCITNVTYSTLAQKCDICLPIMAGNEIAVASTKAYCSMLAVLYLLSEHLFNIKKHKTQNIYKNIKILQKNLNLSLKNEIFPIMKSIKHKNNIFFIGRDLDYISCLEASLKLKEITYKNTEVYPAGELKHGYLALITKKSYVFVIATQKHLLEKTLNSTSEVCARGGRVIFLSQYDIPSDISKNFYKVIKLQKFNDKIMPISSIIWFQFLSYYLCTEKKLNPDKPRNLAKSVTVE